MKNADMPAMPQSANSDGYPCNYYDYGGPGIPTGMTKREMMAMHLHAALLTAQADGVWSGLGVGAAYHAVKEADELLAELERTK